MHTASPKWAPPPLGVASAAALLVGVTCTMGLAALPPPALLWTGLWLGWLGWLRPPRWMPALRLPALFVFGVAVAGLHAQHALSQRIDPALAGADLEVEGRVVGLVRQHGPVTRFDLHLTAAESAPELTGRRVSLGWYGDAPELAPGQVWSLRLRLKRPRGVLNPGGFDRERQSLARRIAATGYVREPDSATRVSPARGLDAWRSRTSAGLGESVDRPGVRYVQALALGDTRGLSGSDWDALRATGLSHLLAISGFHVGVVAGFGALLAGWLSRLWTPALRVLPRPMLMAWAALACAVAYAAAAGFSLPTQRAMLMIAAALLARLLRRPLVPANSYALALVAILVFDPLAVLSAGFWLSFLGVGWLLWCVSDAQGIGYLRGLLGAQLVATLGLAPLGAWFFGQASLIGPLANLVGIPLVTLVVVPLALVGTALEAVWQGAGVGLVTLAARVAELGSGWMASAAGVPGALRHIPLPGLGVLLLSLAGVAWALMPQGVPGRPLGLLLMLPLLWPRPPAVLEGTFVLDLVDVGQGLSLVVHTRSHVLVYDTGPYPRGGLDMGAAAVVPALRAGGVRRLDAIVVSHDDNDHVGGLGAVLGAYGPVPVYGQAAWFERLRRQGGAGAIPEPAQRRACEAGHGWEWDGVVFEFLHPTAYFPDVGNEGSCVLHVRGRDGAALLTGDVGRVVERRLLRLWAERVEADVLVLGHHGSRHSSDAAFLDAVRPRHALVGSAHASRFNHPHPEVVERLDERGIPLSDSGEHGHLRVRWNPDGGLEVQRFRERHRRFWRE